MEILKLASKEYTLAVGGFRADEGSGYLEIKLVTDETVEAVMDVFADAKETEKMQVMNAGTVQATVTGYTERGNVFTHAEGVVVESRTVNDEIQNTLGNTVEFKMYKKSIEAAVERNRADIDYLMMMEGE